MLTAAPTARSMARSVSWGRVVFAALVASAVTFVIMNALVYGPSYAGVTRADLDPFAEFAGGPGAALAFFCVVLLRARRTALLAGELPGAHAVAAGLLSALSLQLIFALLAPPVYLSETIFYLGLGLAAGLLASHLVRGRLTSRSLLYHASAHMRERPSPDAIASVIGRATSRSRPDSVLLWERPRTAGGDPASLLPSGAWVSPASPPLPVAGVGECARALQAALAANGGGWALVNLRRTDACALWRRRGVKQLLVVALRETPTPPGLRRVPSDPPSDEADAPQGLLTVGFRTRGPLPASVRDDYLFLAQQAASVLETVRLLKSAREEARRASDHDNRRRLAQELHDTIKNRWLGVGMLAEASLVGVPDDPRLNGLREKLALIRQEVDHALRHQREIIGRMRRPKRPPAGEENLVSQLEARAQWWSQASGVRLYFAVVGAPDAIPYQTARQLKPVLEEALANVATHARATAVRVTLAAEASVSPRNRTATPSSLATSSRPPTQSRSLILTVADDGVGGAPDEEDRTGGSGLRGMRARAREVGGSLMVHSHPGRGTTITLTIPVPPNPGPELGPDGGWD